MTLMDAITMVMAVAIRLSNQAEQLHTNPEDRKADW